MKTATVTILIPEKCRLCYFIEIVSYDGWHKPIEESCHCNLCGGKDVYPDDKPPDFCPLFENITEVKTKENPYEQELYKELGNKYFNPDYERIEIFFINEIRMFYNKTERVNMKNIFHHRTVQINLKRLKQDMKS